MLDGKSVSIAAGSTLSIFIIYITTIILYLRFFNMVMIDYLRGNGIRINESQFSEACEMIQEIEETYWMKAEKTSIFLHAVRYGGDHLG